MPIRFTGNPRALAAVQRSLAGERPPRSYLFVGPERVGKATLAIQLAQALNCERTVGARHASPLRPDTPIRVRIGLNAGEPIAEDDPDGRADLYGTAVIVAARIAAQAHGGEILVSDVVRQLVAGKGFLFNDRGENSLKGFEDPVRVWEVSWQA
jgi:adenylate cyclase